MTTSSILVHALVLLWIFQTLYLVFSFHRIGWDGLTALASGYVSLACLVYAVGYVCRGFPGLSIAAYGLIFFLYGILCSYRLGTGARLDYALISLNFFWVSAKASFRVILGSLQWEPLWAALFMVLWLVIAPAFFPSLEVPVSFSVFRADLFLVSIGLYMLFIFLRRASSSDELVNFLRSFRRFHAKISPRDANLPAIGQLGDDYPFIRQDAAHRGAPLPSGPSCPRPNVFLIMMESLNAGFLEKRSPEGHIYTPCLNELITKGVYVEHFYANSVQTVHGQAATLFSLLPCIRGNIFNHYRNLNLRSLPTILAEAGYRTHFFQGEKHLDIENTRPFIKKHGFHKVERVQDYLDRDDKDSIWGWGPTDGVIYRRFFDYLDMNENGARSSSPHFAVISTINNHMAFDVPKRKRRLYGKPATMRQKYANSLHIADDGLAVFFAELAKRPCLKNSIIIITGDHSFPTGGHGIVRNEIAFYEESFRIPLLILWDGRLPPLRITDSVHSQMDIAPTLLDMLKLDIGPNHFQGDSIFSNDPERPVTFIQPYAGVYVGIVTVYHKYVRHLSTGREFLFSLKEDPEENQDLIGSPMAARLAPLFHRGLAYAFLNQHLIEQNRVWREPERPA